MSATGNIYNIVLTKSLVLKQEPSYDWGLSRMTASEAAG